jgi:hypothetical membrane protein
MLRKALLACGVLSSLLYLGIDALAALRFGDYHSYTAQAISELGAIGAPTRELVEPLFMTYNVLLLAFAVGVWATAGRKRALRLIGALLAGIVAVGLVTPPMYLRGTGHGSGDLPHIVFTGLIVVFILSATASGTSLYGRRWRIYSWATLLVLLVSGAWTGVEAQRLAAGQLTPWLGVAERINIGAYLLWVAVLATILVRGHPGLRNHGAVRGAVSRSEARVDRVWEAGTRLEVR